MAALSAKIRAKKATYLAAISLSGVLMREAELNGNPGSNVEAASCSCAASIDETAEFGGCSCDSNRKADSARIGWLAHERSVAWPVTSRHVKR